MSDILLDTPPELRASAAPIAPVTPEPDPAAALLFGDARTPPLWLWLAVEPEEVTALERALLDHLRSPLFPTRIGERPIAPGDDQGRGIL